MEKLNWHKGSGVIRYDPKRPGLRSRTQWWAVVDVDREITRYYRWWINKEILNPLNINSDGMQVKYPWVNLCQPSWDAHISIVRGEKPRPDLMHLWKKYDGEKVDFMYRHYPRVSGDTTQDRPSHYWFVEVFCPKLDDIRNELQLKTGWKYHITVGRTWD